jgi:hypothetical protein
MTKPLSQTAEGFLTILVVLGGHASKTEVEEIAIAFDIQNMTPEEFAAWKRLVQPFADVQIKRAKFLESSDV